MSNRLAKFQCFISTETVEVYYKAFCGGKSSEASVATGSSEDSKISIANETSKVEEK